MDIVIGMGLLGAFLLVIRIIVTIKNPGKELNKKFVSLGRLVGKTKEQIRLVAGDPSDMSLTYNNLHTCTWKQDWYSITLEFDANNYCTRIIHQKLK